MIKHKIIHYFWSRMQQIISIILHTTINKVPNYWRCLLTTPHVADNVIVYQAISSCINLINIGVLQEGFFVFCKLGWGETDVFIAVRGKDYDWVVVVECLFDNQRKIDIVRVNKISFAVCITQEPLRECCRMVKTKQKF